MQRHLAQQLGVILLGQFLCATGAENRLMVTAVAANMHAHVLDDTQHRHFDFFEHHDAFFASISAISCGVVTTTAPVTGMFCASVS
jgi:hypothetical protein